MAKLTLTAAPTFDAVVDIPQVSGDKVPVRFTFRHRTQDELKALSDAEMAEDAPPVADEDMVLQIASGWELEEEFTIENVRTFCQHFTGARFAITGAYYKAYLKARLGN